MLPVISTEEAVTGVAAQFAEHFSIDPLWEFCGIKYVVRAVDGLGLNCTLLFADLNR